MGPTTLASSWWREAFACFSGGGCTFSASTSFSCSSQTYATHSCRRTTCTCGSRSCGTEAVSFTVTVRVCERRQQAAYFKRVALGLLLMLRFLPPFVVCCPLGAGDALLSPGKRLATSAAPLGC